MERVHVQPPVKNIATQYDPPQRSSASRKRKTASVSVQVNIKPKGHVKRVQVEPSIENIATQCDPPQRSSSDKCLQTQRHDERMDANEEGADEEYEYHDDVERDPDFFLATSSTSHRPRADNIRSGLENERKYIVFEDELLALFAHMRCEKCHKKVLSSCIAGCVGSMLRIAYACEGGHKMIWNSQPLIGSMPAGNLLVSAAIIVSGGSYEQFHAMSHALNLCFFSDTTFYNIQSLVSSAVHTTYITMKEATIAALCDKPVSLMGDGRCDSPGFSAKYSTYTIMEEETGAILTYCMKQVQTGKSTASLEVDGCRDAIEELQSYQCVIERFATDANKSVAKMMREDHPEISHQFELFHLDKRMTKRLLATSKKADCKILTEWVKPIRRHLWWASQTCEHDADVLREKWLSLMFHITNQHAWLHLKPEFERYRECAHGPLESDKERKTKWLKPGSPPHEALTKILRDTRLLKDIQMATYAMHTGGLECYHNMLLKYCSKRLGFSHEGMLMRTELAVLDHNFGLGRKQAACKDGRLKYKIVFPKRTREWVAKHRYEPKCYLWRRDILRDVIAIKQGKLSVIERDLLNLPENIASKQRPCVQSVIEKTKSRFIKN